VLVDPSYRARGSSGAHARHSRSEAPGPVQEAPSLRSPRSAGRHLTRSVRCASARTPGIIDYDDHFFFAAWVLQAIFGVAHSISSQLRRPDPGSVRYSKRTSTRRRGRRSRFKKKFAHTCSTMPGVGVLGLQLGPLPASLIIAVSMARAAVRASARTPSPGV
jgi:hypothetical protein